MLEHGPNWFERKPFFEPKKNAGCFRGLVNYDVVGMIDLTGKVALLIGEYGWLLNLLGSMLIMNSPIVQIR